jgi:CheY-like chemotaxis protein
LILLDIMMPGMDGYAVSQALKSNPATQHIPIIFLTAMTDVASKVKAFELGGVDYISKPFNEVAPI